MIKFSILKNPYIQFCWNQKKFNFWPFGLSYLGPFWPLIPKLLGPKNPKSIPTFLLWSLTLCLNFIDFYILLLKLEYENQMSSDDDDDANIIPIYNFQFLRSYKNRATLFSQLSGLIHLVELMTFAINTFFVPLN